MHDLLLRGGTVVDPSSGLDGISDIAVQDGVIARIATDIPSAEATRTIEVAGKIVTPGLIDLHAHVFEGFNRSGVHPDLGGVHAGVTTIVDAGSAGAATFGGFPRHIIPRCHTEVSLPAHLPDRARDPAGHHRGGRHPHPLLHRQPRRRPVRRLGSWVFRFSSPGPRPGLGFAPVSGLFSRTAWFTSSQISLTLLKFSARPRAREARGEAEDQDDGQGGDGADAGMREQEAGASRKTKAHRNFFLTGLGSRIYQSREVIRGLNEARMTPPELPSALWYAKAGRT